MKDRNNPAVEYSVALKPASQEEAGLFYSDEKQDEVLGTVGHLRIDFGSGGKSFWSTWWPHNSDQFNTPEFKRELQQIVDTLRRNGPLQSLSAMSSYCWTHGGEISTNDRVYGYIAETELTDDPSVREAVDDILWDFVGEENPRRTNREITFGGLGK